MFEVILHRRAARYFHRLEPKVQGQLRTKFETLGRDPLGNPESNRWPASGTDFIGFATAACASSSRSI